MPLATKPTTLVWGKALSFSIARRVSLFLLALRGGGRGTDQDRSLGLPSMLTQPDREGLSLHMLPPSLVQDVKGEMEGCDFSLLANDCAQAFHVKFDARQLAQYPALAQLAGALADLGRSGAMNHVPRTQPAVRAHGESDSVMGGIEVVVLRRGCYRCPAPSGGGFFARGLLFRVC